MRSRAKAGASVPRTGELCLGEAGSAPIFLGRMVPAGSQSRTPGGQGCPRAPWDTNRHLRDQESAPSSLRAAARTAGPGGTGAARRGSGGGSAEGVARPREQLGGARAAAPRRGLRGPGARIHQRRLRSTGRRDTAQDPASPGTGRGREGPGQRGRSCPELSRSAAPPRSLQALQTEFLPELNPGFQSCPATGAVPPAASRGKQPPLSPAPGRGTAAPPTANT